jgi:CheY-like chemotaxis protein
MLEGFDVVTATDGKDALDQLERTPDTPGLIILDLMMPVMDGWSFRARQLEDPRWSAIPTLIVTAGERISWEALRVEADQLIPKPIELDALLAAIERNGLRAPSVGIGA